MLAKNCKALRDVRLVSKTEAGGSETALFSPDMHFPF
jgi:hypothetical protein